MNMLSLGLEKHLEELTLCSSQASKEYGLENVILHILINSNLFNFYTELSCLNVLALQCSLNDSNSQILQISQAGLSRVNGVRRSSAETWNFNHLPKAQFYINRFDIWREWLR